MAVFKGYDAVKDVVDRIVNWLRIPESEQYILEVYAVVVN